MFTGGERKLAIVAGLLAAGIVGVVVLGILVGESPQAPDGAPQEADDPDDAHDGPDVVSERVTVGELSDRWNSAIDAYEGGYRLPDELRATDQIGDLDVAEIPVGDDPLSGLLFVAWDPDTREVLEVAVEGFLSGGQAHDLGVAAGAMMYATGGANIDGAYAAALGTLPDEGIDEVVVGGRRYSVLRAGDSVSWEFIIE